MNRKNLSPTSAAIIALLGCLHFFSAKAQSPTCDLVQIASTFTGAGYVPLDVQGQPCSVYFVNPNSMGAAEAQTAAAALGANLVVMNTAAENAAVAAALNASQFNGSTIWIGYQRTGTAEQTFFASDGTTGPFVPNNNDPNIYQNWAGGEPNNSGFGGGTFGCDYECEFGEQCVQIYPNAGWNDLPCNENSISVIEVNLCPEITIEISANNVCGGTPVDLSATTLLGSEPYSYTWDTGQTGADITVTPMADTEYTATVTDRYACSAEETVTITTLASASSEFTVDGPVCIGAPATVTYTGTGQPGSTYVWDFDGGIPTSGTGSGPYEVGWATPGDKDVTLEVTESGCTSPVTTVTVTVEESPVADFTFTTECFGTPTEFTNTSTGAVAFSAWVLEGDTIFSNDASHIFSAAGTFTVSLGVSTANGCPGTISQQVTVNAQPTAAFTAPDVCLGENTPFTDESTATGGTIASHDWDFGDAIGTSDQPSPTYTFTDPDSYDVTLTVTSTQGCVDAVTETVIVGVLPEADFTIVDACTGDPLEFIDATTIAAGNLTDWDWDFGDMNESTDQNPQHVYAIAGTYDVTLTVSSGNCSDVMTMEATSFPNPVADFTTNDICLGEDAVFTDNSSVTGSDIAQWAWDFDGEGNAMTEDATFNFNDAETYTVTLGVITADLCADTHSEEITVHPAPEPAFSAEDVCFGDPTVFANESMVSTGVIVAQVWDFGDDDGTSTDASPSYTYGAAATYPVTLGVTTSFGCIGTITQNVTVTPLPVIDASHQNILCASQTNGQAFATASGATAPYSYQWNNAQQETTPDIEGLGPGPYTVTVTDVLGCASDTTVTVEQPLPLNVQMTAGDDTCGLGNGAVQANMLGGTPPFVYQWSAIRDSSTIFSELDPPVGWNTMLTPGEYSVIITDSAGCQTEGVATVGLIPAPEADFSSRNKPEEFKDPSVNFFNESTAAISYEWHFGDDNISSLEHPTHDYENGGVYLVMLIASNEERYGCTDTAFRYVEVDPMFTFYVPNAFTPDGDDLNDVWLPKGENYEIESYNAKVFDRWGKLVWQTDNPEFGWNGRDMQSLEPCKQGVYVFQVVVKYFNTYEPRVINGSVTLYRNR